MNEDVALALAVLAAVAVGFPLLIILINHVLHTTLDDLDATEAELKKRRDAQERLTFLRVAPKRRSRPTRRRRRSAATEAPPSDELLERFAGLLEALGAETLAAVEGIAVQLEGLEWTVRATAAPNALAAPNGIPGESLELHIGAGAVDAQDFRLRLRPHLDVNQDELAFLDVRRVGRKAFDRRFVIESADRTAVDALRAGSVRKACAQVFDVPGIKALTLGDGWVHATGVVRSGTGRKKLRALIKGLRVVAEALGHPRTVTVRGAGASIRSAEERCPYCHDALASEAECLTCDACGTMLHTECHRELLGRCPVLGCEGGSTSLVSRVPS